jgi:micrococcal nuclease
MNWRFWRILPMTLVLLAGTAVAKDIAPSDVRVVNGDTIVVRAETYRLVGFDTPETAQAKCASERKLGYRAAFRLRRIIAGGGLDLEPVKCGEGGACATLRVLGQSVADLMIGQGFARTLACTTASCPSHKSWCTGTHHG